MKSAIVERELGSDDKVRGLDDICEGGGRVAICRAHTPRVIEWECVLITCIRLADGTLFSCLLIVPYPHPPQFYPHLQERALLDEGIRRFPSYAKFYLMLGQLEEKGGHTEAARAVYRWEGDSERGGCTVTRPGRPAYRRKGGRREG